MSAFQIKKLATYYYLSISHIKISFVSRWSQNIENVTSFASFHNWMEKIWNLKQNINFKQSIVIASDIYMTRAFSKINTDLIRCYWGVFNLTTKLCKCVVRRDDTKYPFSENHLYIDSRMAPATCRYLLGCVKVYFLFINLAENIENWTYFQFSGSVV